MSRTPSPSNCSPWRRQFRSEQHVRPNQLRSVSDRIRHDLYGHHRARVQAFAAGAGGPARRYRPGAYCHPDCPAGGRAQADHSRCLAHRAPPIVRLGGGNSDLNNTFDPTNYEVFQTVFGMIFTVIIALEFKRSLLVLADRRDGIVQVRTVILIALLAVVRKLIILDVSHTEPLQLFALAAAIPI